MSAELGWLVYFFAAFAGVFLLAGSVFLSTFYISGSREYKNYLWLCFFNLAYLVVSIYFLYSEISDFKINFLFILQAFNGSGAFYFYIKAVSERLYLRSKFLKLTSGFLIYVMVASLIMALSYFTEARLFMAEQDFASTNFFFLKTIGNYNFSNLTLGLLAPLPFLVLATNLYLLVRIYKLRLRGFHRLLLMGVTANVFLNLNDNLLAVDFFKYSFPLVYAGYTFEIVYFLILSLRSYAVPRNLKTLPGFSNPPLKKKETDEDPKESCPLRSSFLFAIDSLKQSYPNLNIALEANLDGSLMVDRKQEDLAVMIYHVLWEIFENVNSSPRRSARLVINVIDDSPRLITFTENSPSNYDKNPPSGDMLRLQRVVNCFNGRIHFSPGEKENIYRLRL